MKGIPPADLAGDRAPLGDDALVIEFVDQLLERFQREIARKDHPDGLGFGSD